MTIPWPVHPAAELFPLLDGDELAELADDIRAHGLREPVWLWDDPERGTVLLDGRNRTRACEAAGVQPITRRFHGDGLDAVEFVITENIRRRHLNAGQKAGIAHDLLPLLEDEMGKRRARAIATAAAQRERDEKGRLKANAESQMVADRPPSGKPPKRLARDKAAKRTGASGRAVGRFKRVADQAPDLAAKVKSGDISLDRAERIIRDREAEQRRIEQARAEAAAAPERARVDIRHGDFREVLADLDNVDAVITDPPYPFEFLPLLADLAVWADKVLAPHGVMAVLMGQSHLPEVYRLLDGHRPYRWTGCYLTPGSGYVSHTRKVQTNWKPLIVYGGGPRFADTVRTEASDADAKNNHKWGQDYSAFHTIIERLTSRGQTVVDPFMGSGTTLLAAHALGRHAIGCDVDPEAVAKARERLA